jgi:hypothetical protein
MKPNDHNLATAASDRAEIDAAMAEYKSSWPELCKQLDITSPKSRRSWPTPSASSPSMRKAPSNERHQPQRSP